MAVQAGDLEKAYLADRAGARSRDVALAQAGRRNIRADIADAAARAERTVLEETDTRWQGAALAESSMLAAIEVWG